MNKRNVVNGEHGVAVYSDSSLKLAVDEVVQRRVSFNMFISLAEQFNEAVEKISEKTGIELRKFDIDETRN